MRRIFLYGPPGSGKTVVGKILAENLDANFVDIDSQIELETGMSVAQIITGNGESVFRDMEQAVIERLCEASNPAGVQQNWLVVALGGGALLRERNRTLCENSGEVIFLEASFSTLLERLKKEQDQRPLLSGDLETRLSTLLKARKEHYDSFNMRVVNNTSTNLPSINNKNPKKTPGQISWEVQQKLGCYHVRGMGTDYDVMVEIGGLSRVGVTLKERGIKGPVALVCDENVDILYSKQVEKSLSDQNYLVSKLVIKSGEENKTLDTVSSLWKGFLAAGLDRKSLVIALGGGVVSDLAGFAASTYMRGCPWVAIPTTLLSMVDASLGGKTGFDLPEGKNLVGSFFPPQFVLSDPDLLNSLPESELRSGLAEVIKHGIISDPNLFYSCSRGYKAVKDDLGRIVRQAIGVKARIITEDPYERGIRAALNLGHTVGHAIELASHFELKHGEAVAIGLVVEAKLAEKLGLAENHELTNEIESVLLGIGLPVEIPEGLSHPKIIQAMRTDKKKDGGVIKFALPAKIGKVIVGVSVSNLEEVL